MIKNFVLVCCVVVCSLLFCHDAKAARVRYEVVEINCGVSSRLDLSGYDGGSVFRNFSINNVTMWPNAVIPSTPATSWTFGYLTTKCSGTTTLTSNNSQWNFILNSESEIAWSQSFSFLSGLLAALAFVSAATSKVS